MENTAITALKNVQDAFAGGAERLDLKSEQDVADMIKELRRERWEQNNETLEAICEVQRMKADPSIGKAYTDVDAMMKELL